MIRKKITSFLIASASVVTLLACVPVARANSIEVGSVNTTFDGSMWDYAYHMILTAGNGITAATPATPERSSLFVFYDLSGLTGARATFTSGTTPSSSWNIVFENKTETWSGGQSTIGSQGGSAVENDLPNVLNVRFQYTGSDFSAVGTNSDIGIAHLFSTLPPGLYGQFAARWLDSNGLTQVNTQSPPTPTLSGGAGPSVPLPAAAWMGISSMASLGLLSHFRRRRV